MEEQDIMPLQPKESDKWVIIACSRRGLQLIGSEEDKERSFNCSFCHIPMEIKEIDKKT
jgi:hypothetical protein